MEIEISVDLSDVREAKADSRGRINLGTDFAGKTVEVVVLDADEDQEQLAD